MILCFFFRGGDLPWMQAEISDMEKLLDATENAMPIPGLGAIEIARQRRKRRRQLEKESLAEQTQIKKDTTIKELTEGMP